MTIEDKLVRNYDAIKQALRTRNYTVSDYKSISYGIQFTISRNKRSGVIRLFQNKKGNVTIDFSQLRDSLIEDEIRPLMSNEIKSDKKQGKSRMSHKLPIIGTDESGKGDYFGPLVSAAVYVDEHSAKLLELEGVKDSKKLNDKKNVKLAEKIMTICKNRYSIIEISPEKYNDLYDRFVGEKKNLNNLLAWGHAKAIEELLGKVECNNAMADQFADERYILSKLQEKGRKLNLIQMHRAEENIAVAAASILARARFLQKLSKLSSEYGIELPKGASINVINTAKRIIAGHGKDALRKIAKVHFKTTKEVRKTS